MISRKIVIAACVAAGAVGFGLGCAHSKTSGAGGSDRYAQATQETNERNFDPDNTRSSKTGSWSDDGNGVPRGASTSDETMSRDAYGGSGKSKGMKDAGTGYDTGPSGDINGTGGSGKSKGMKDAGTGGVYDTGSSSDFGGTGGSGTYDPDQSGASGGDTGDQSTP